MRPVSQDGTPPQRVDYGEAARRHHRDAELLLGAERRANADHLYGIAAECALLGILRTSPTTHHMFGADGGALDRLRCHVNVLWNQFCREAQGWRLGGTVSRMRAAYPGKARNPGDRPPPLNPFQGWSVDQRYLADAAVAAEIPDEVVKKHRAAAELCLKMLDDAQQARPAGGAR